MRILILVVTSCLVISCCRIAISEDKVHQTQEGFDITRYHDNLDEAIIDYIKKLESNPKHIGALLFLAQAYKEKGDYETAGIYYKKLVEYYPEREMFHLQLSGYFLLVDKYDNAIEELENAEQLGRREENIEGPGAYNPWYYSLLRARIYKAMGKYAEALKEYNNYLDNEPATSEVDEDIERIEKERDEVKRIIRDNKL